MANTNNTAPATKVVVPCRISFANIWEARSINGGDEKYSVSCLISKKDKATLAKIKQAIEAAKEAAKTKKWGGKLPPNLKMPMHDGDEDRPDDVERPDYRHNHLRPGGQGLRGDRTLQRGGHP